MFISSVSGSNSATPTRQTAASSGANALPEPNPKPDGWSTTASYSKTPKADGGSTEIFVDDQKNSVVYENDKNGKHVSESDFKPTSPQFLTSGLVTTYKFDSQQNRTQTGAHIRY